MDNAKLKEKIAQMQGWRSDATYYAITLLVNHEGLRVTNTQSELLEFVDNDSKRARRVAVPVNPEWMIDNWRYFGQNYIVVEDGPGLYIFLHTGGNALVEETVAKRWYSEWLKPKEYVRVSLAGWMSIKDLSAQAFKHAPTPTHRMRILKRDHFKCRLCGRNPDTNVDIELHVHHIRPFGSGGVTHDKNLITLCHTCHKGLEPHEDQDLFELVGSGVNALVQESKDEYWAGVRRYRGKIQDLYERGYLNIKGKSEVG